MKDSEKDHIYDQDHAYRITLPVVNRGISEVKTQEESQHDGNGNDRNIQQQDGPRREDLTGENPFDKLESWHKITLSLQI